MGSSLKFKIRNFGSRRKIMRVRAAFAVHAIGLMATLWMSSLAFGQADWTQRFPTHVPPKRMYPAMAQFGSCSQSSCGGNVVMFGGLNLGPAGNFNQFNALSDTWVWNGTDWTQVSTIATPSARYGASMAYDFTTGSAVLFEARPRAASFFRILGSSRASSSVLRPPVVHLLFHGPR